MKVFRNYITPSLQLIRKCLSIYSQLYEKFLLLTTNPRFQSSRALLYSPYKHTLACNIKRIKNSAQVRVRSIDRIYTVIEFAKYDHDARSSLFSRIEDSDRARVGPKKKDEIRAT